MTGIEYSHVATFDLSGRPNEATIRFSSGGEMFVVVRNEDRDPRHHGHLGRSVAPYVEWKWNEIEVGLGGPNIVLLGNSLILGTREYGDKTVTVLRSLTKNGKIAKTFRLKRMSTSTADERIVKMARLAGFEEEGTQSYTFKWKGKLYPTFLLGKTVEE